VNDRPAARTQLASLAIAVFLIDPDMVIREVNAAAEQLMGLSAKRLAGRRLDAVIAFHDGRLAERLAQGDALITAHAVSVSLNRQPERRIDLTLSPVLDHQGWQSMTLQEAVDRRELDDETYNAVRTPAILAHEIKNPLAGIRGAAQLLARKAAEQERALTTLITDEVDRIAKLIDRMQSLGRERPEPVSACNLHEAIRHARAVVEVAGKEAVDVLEEFDPSLPSVLGNHDALVQILINLLSNAMEACKHAQEPRVIVRTRFVSGFVMNAIRLGRPIRLPIELRVSDNGPGIDPALRDHIFEPFVSSKANGQGLGLALVKKLVRDMDGRITHEREAGEGWTHFYIHLPMTKPAEGSTAP
jgi:two-component system nitrogen regulation sensor histidine kinase GlnL